MSVRVCVCVCVCVCGGGGERVRVPGLACVRVHYVGLIARTNFGLGSCLV